MGKVLITGVSGFIAGHVAREALANGWSVRGTVRDLASADRARGILEEAGADVSRFEVCEANLLGDEGWEEAMEGVDVLCHCASPFTATAPKDPNELIRPAVDGTRRAVSAAIGADVQKIALTSSFAAVGFGGAVKGAPYDGADWTVSGGKGVTAYYESKLQAEKTAWALVDAAGQHDRLTVINPGLVLGPPLHNDLSTSVVLVKRLLKGEFPLAPDYSIPVVDVRDVAAMHVRAFQPDLGGERIVMGQETVSILEMADMLREIAPGARLPKRLAPSFMLRLVGLFDRSVASIVDDLGVRREIDRSAAEAALGRSLIPAREAVVESARALIAAGVA